MLWQKPGNKPQTSRLRTATSISMVNYPPLRNSKRCFKASTQNYKIEALKLVGEPKVAIPRFRPCVVSDSFYKIV
ncbi:hypothetical protein FUT84_02850 [Treponema phagedenis]|nr:hypothetical protein FUT79_02905 [Treponema phagedenis]QEK00217.1 hypothetical protein FUT84_02850 [Treponema phagedenis]QEK07711.1 hypothetical protein FUT80_13955 [Treponema phagedenis]